MACNEIIEILGSPNRFYLSDGLVKRKIFSLFQASSDGSLAFHSYSQGETAGEFDSDSVADGQTFSTRDVEMKEFKLHKFNFHKSGTVTRKDKAGGRSHDDFHSIEFQKIKDAITLFVFQPTFLGKYPVINDKKEYVDLIQGKHEYLPPNAQIILSKKGYNLEDDFKDKVDSTLFVNGEILAQFDLNLCINVRRHSTGKYSKTEVIASVLY